MTRRPSAVAAIARVLAASCTPWPPMPVSTTSFCKSRSPLYLLRPMTLLVGALLADAAAVNPDGIAVTLDDEALSYRQLERMAARMAAALAPLGLPAGERVVWWSDPDLRSLAGFAAVARAGLVFAPLNPAFSLAEAGAAVEYLAPSLVVAD